MAISTLVILNIICKLILLIRLATQKIFYPYVERAVPYLDFFLGIPVLVKKIRIAKAPGKFFGFSFRGRCKFNEHERTL